MLSPQFLYTETAHKKFECDGFVHFDNFLTTEALSSLRTMADTVWQTKQRQWMDFDYQQPESEDNDLSLVTPARELGNNEKLLTAMSQLFGGKPVLHAVTAVIYKQNKKSIVSPWHRDADYFMTIWICLDDVGPENGGMVVKPGWHSKKIESGHCECNTLKFSELGITQEEFEKDKVTYNFKAGQAAFHHPKLPHASFENSTSNPRRVVCLRYRVAE